MNQHKTHSTRDEMDPRMLRTVVQMMESQAYRELAAAQLLGHGLQFVPRLKYLKFVTWHITEEMDHYERVARMYESLTGESVEPVVADRLAQKPVPLSSSWFDLAMAQFLYDRGGFWQLREYELCAFLPYRDTIRTILDEEARHQQFGERIVVELCASGHFESVKQASFETWLRQGLLSFGRPGSEGSRYAVQVGLKKRDAAEVMRDFLEDIAPAVRACGLRFPELADIGIVGPAAGGVQTQGASAA
jgi:1,2-phenylacetyl-CoA epoxidase catalytic subunit